VSGGINVSGKLVDPDDEAPFSNEPAPARNEVVTASFVAPPADRSSQSAVMETSMNWDLRLDTDGAKLNSGIELSKIHGMVRLIGAYDGKTAYSEGQLKIDSLLALGMQITNIEGPLWIDSQHVGFGFFAAPFGSQANQKSVTGKLFSGQLNLDGQTWFADDTRFYLHATVDSAKLKAAAACLAPSMESIDGTAQFALRLSGNTNSQESFTGEGMIKMYNAKIYELPVLLATLKQLRRFNEDKSAFDSCNIDFSIQGRKATINRMDLLGEPISLIGNGIVDLDRNVNLNFYTIAGRNRFYVPLISELYQAGSQQIMWINVDGTLDMPQTSRQILPGINEGLKELFQIPDN
jgi:hypothetical protein